MNKNRKFNDILDECLERLLAKGETLEQCLQSYPEQAAELKPLLETALATKRASAIEPRSEFRATARYQFHSALQAIGPKRPFFGWLPRWATVVAIVLALLLAGGGGTVAAAAGSMPDEPLYPVKIASEQVRLALTPSPLGKAELYANLADKRVAEIIYVANKGDARQIELTTQRLNYVLTRIAVLVSGQMEEAGIKRIPLPAPAFVAPDESTENGKGINIQANNRAKLRLALARYAINHPAALRAVLNTAPEPTKSALRQAIAISVAGYEKALKAAGD
jgi:hypothetical protein